MTFRCRPVTMPAKYYPDYYITGSSAHEQNRKSRTSCWLFKDIVFSYHSGVEDVLVAVEIWIIIMFTCLLHVLWFYNFAVIYPPLPVFTISWLHVGICRETLNSRKIYFTAMVRKTGCCRSQWDMTCWWIKCTAVYISSSDSLCPQKLLRLL